MNMVIDRSLLVKTFVIFLYFPDGFFVKSIFLTTQEELEALLWICFTPMIVFLSFEGKTFFSKKKMSKKSWRKKSHNFSQIFYGFVKKFGFELRAEGGILTVRYIFICRFMLSDPLTVNSTAIQSRGVGLSPEPKIIV